MINKDKEVEIDPIRGVKIGVTILIIVILLWGSFFIIHPGQRGVLVTLGKPSMDAKAEGLNFKIPIIQSVVKMDVKVQRFDAPQVSAASKDLQTVSTDVTLNYRINPENVPTIYREIGINYQDKVIVPAVQEIVKSITAQYTAEELITKRQIAKEAIDIALKERLLRSSIFVTEISITNFKFSAEFDKAIESKVTAEQNALAAKNKLEQVKYEKEQRIAQAEGEAEAIRIQAQAITQQGGANYVELQRIQKWNGAYPQIMGGGVTPIVDMRSIIGGAIATNLTN